MVKGADQTFRRRRRTYPINADEPASLMLAKKRTFNARLKNRASDTPALLLIDSLKQAIDPDVEKHQCLGSNE
jgi:hypothetical protein